MTNPWAAQMGYFILTHGLPMRNSHEQPMGNPRASMGNPRETHGQLTGNLWATHGEPMGHCTMQ